MYKHIFFDLDHTIWDFETNAKESLKDLYYQMQLHSKGVKSFELLRMSNFLLSANFSLVMFNLN